MHFMILVLFSDKQTVLFWKPLMYFSSGDSYAATFLGLVIMWQFTNLSFSFCVYNACNAFIQNVFSIF